MAKFAHSCYGFKGVRPRELAVRFATFGTLMQKLPLNRHKYGSLSKALTWVLA